MSPGGLDISSMLVYHSHRFIQQFRPTETGTAVGAEFEDGFRDSLIQKLECDSISSRRELGMGLHLVSHSRLTHELDLVIRHQDKLFVFELKHYAANPLNKEMVLVFNQKVLDFYLENYPTLSQFQLYRLFITRSCHIEEGLRRFCAMWGILLIDRQLYSPLICQLILQRITAETSHTNHSHPAPVGLFQLEHLQTLEKQSSALNIKLWRSLDSLFPYNPCLSPFKGLLVDLEQLPSANITNQWLHQQHQLSKEVSNLKAQFTAYSNEKEKLKVV